MGGVGGKWGSIWENDAEDEGSDLEKWEYQIHLKEPVLQQVLVLMMLSFKEIG